MHLIGLVGQKVHLTDKPARPVPPVVVLKSHSVATATQLCSATWIVPRLNHSAYHGFRIPPRDDDT